MVEPPVVALGRTRFSAVTHEAAVVEPVNLVTGRVQPHGVERPRGARTLRFGIAGDFNAPNGLRAAEVRERIRVTVAGQGYREAGKAHVQQGFRAQRGIVQLREIHDGDA